MNQSLLLPSSINFEDSNLVDNIRQTYIDLHTEPSEEDVRSFLKEAKTYLDKDLQENVANELFAAILSGFLRFPQQMVPFFEEYLKNSRQNSNYIIITALILSRLTHVEPQVTLFDYQSFVNDALNEILPQIQKKENEELTVFGQTISPEFKIDLILNLLLSSQTKGKLVSKFLPFVSSRDIVKTNPSLVLLFDDISKTGLIEIKPQTDESTQELIEFITKQDIHLIPKMNEASLSFIEFCATFITSHRTEYLEKLTKEMVLPFIAVIFVYIKKNQFDIKFTEVKIRDLLWEGVRYLETVDSQILKASIDLIISNYTYFDKYSFTSFNEILQMLGILVQQLVKGTYKGDPMILLFATFDLSNNSYFQWDVKFFFQKYGNDIFTYIFKNIYDINRYDRYKDRIPFQMQSLDLDMIDSVHVTFQIIKMPPDDMLQALFFIRHFCTKRLNDECLQKIAEREVPIIHDRIKQKKWDELLFMVQFMKKYGFIEKIKDVNKSDLPESISDLIFGFIPNEKSDIDDLLKHILSHPNPEKDDQLFKVLFDKMICDQDILHSYLGYAVAKYSNFNYPIKKFLTMFLNEFKQYPTVFMEVVNSQFYYNERSKSLIRKPDYDLSSLPISEYGLSIISKLYKAVENKTNCFQAFLCLKNIASSFPFLFINNPQQVFDVVLPYLENISLIFNKHLNNERIELFKTSFSALSFLLSTFHATIILDKFIQWFFVNSDKFTNAQVFCFIMVLRATFSVHLSIENCPVWIIKYKVFDVIGKLLQRDIPKTSFGFDFKENIYLFLVDVYNQFLNYSKYEVLQKNEFVNIENPLTYAFQHSFTTFPWQFKHMSIFFFHRFAILDDFMNNSQNESHFWLSYDSAKHRHESPKADQINDFISKLNESHNLIRAYKLPSIPKKMTVKMVRHIVMKSALIYMNVLLREEIPLVQETFDMTAKVIDEIVQIGQENDPDDIDMNDFDSDELLKDLYEQPTLLSSLIQQVTLQVFDYTKSSSINDVFHAIANSEKGLILIFNLTSQKLTDIYNKRLITDSDSSSNAMYRLICDLTKISKVNGFREHFFKMCGNNLLEIVLSPDFRSNKVVMLEASKFFYSINCKLPIRITHFIGFLLILENQEGIMQAFKLCSKLNEKQLEFVRPLVVEFFDKEMNKEKVTPELIQYLDLFPSISIERRMKLRPLLKKQLETLSKMPNKDEQTINLISRLFNSLAPRPGVPLKLPPNFKMNLSPTSSDSSVVPDHIMKTLPPFWSLYDRYHEMIDEIISKDPLRLKQFDFLLDYPELVSFEVRSEFFRKASKSEINMFRRPTLHVDRRNILETSFNEFQKLSTSEIKHGFNIEFEGEKVTDEEVTKKDWFNSLSKEIFDPQNGLFTVTKPHKCLIPNSLSNHLSYFNFVGQFIALALIDGATLNNAHFASSIIKVILDREPDIEDLQEVDDELYKSLKWILENDVESKGMTFQVDVEESGIIKTILLKDHGSDIKVTNDNKNEFVHLRSKYTLEASIRKQMKELIDGFDSFVPNRELMLFTPFEFEMLLCGIPHIDVNDFRRNVTYCSPYKSDTDVVKFFFNAISKWESSKLSELLIFMTGTSRVPQNGFNEYDQISSEPLKIVPGGSKSNLPQRRVDINALFLPEYENEDELNDKLLEAISNSSPFDSD